ncbi:MAG TPA: glycosyltransferase family 87 protein [Anaerolineales bacterium]
MRPFRNTNPRTWLNLALASLGLFYALYLGWQTIQHMMCSQIGVDYCDYLAAATAANDYGYARIYDLQFLERAQHHMLTTAGLLAPIPVLPYRYLPVFVLPFQLLSGLSPEIGFWIWTAVNVLALLVYLQFFLHRLHLDPAPVRLLLLLFACLPVFMNLLTGQVNVWLVISIGEFMRALLNRKPFRAGLWLGGLLLKPQLLVLIGLVLLLHRAWKTLAGLAATSAALAALSLMLTGPAGFVQMLGLWLATADAPANVWVEGMMNWRMLGLHLSSLIGPWIGWGFAVAGMLITLIATLLVWRRPFNADSPSFPLALLGVLAASLMITWHSHIHMAMIVIPPMIYLLQAKILPQRVLDYWVVLPAGLYLIMVFVPAAMMKLNALPPAAQPWIYFSIGAGEFSANLYLFWWAATASRTRSRAPSYSG